MLFTVLKAWLQILNSSALLTKLYFTIKVHNEKKSFPLIIFLTPGFKPLLKFPYFSLCCLCVLAHAYWAVCHLSVGVWRLRCHMCWGCVCVYACGIWSGDRRVAWRHWMNVAAISGCPEAQVSLSLCLFLSPLLFQHHISTKGPQDHYPITVSLPESGLNLPPPSAFLLLLSYLSILQELINGRSNEQHS